MTLNDIGKALWKALSAMVTAASGIALCVGSLAIGIATEILMGVLSFVFGILITTVSLVLNRLNGLVTDNLKNQDMKRKRHSKSAFQQCRYYEVDNIFEYMVETYINGNFSTFRELYHELNKEARKDFIGFLLVECSPQYHIEILQEIV